MKKFTTVITLVSIMSVGAILSSCSSSPKSEMEVASDDVSASDHAALEGLAAAETAMPDATASSMESTPSYGDSMMSADTSTSDTSSSGSSYSDTYADVGSASKPSRRSPVDLGASSAGRAH